MIFAEIIAITVYIMHKPYFGKIQSKQTKSYSADMYSAKKVAVLKKKKSVKPCS